MLEAFHDRLRDLCANDGEGSGSSREEVIKDQTLKVRALADEFGILKAAGITWDELRLKEPELDVSSEHIVELSPKYGRVGKMTIPGRFGLIPMVVTHQAANVRNHPSNPAFRQTLEFGPGAPLEYLRRWMDANELFNDDVKLVSVVEWADGQISFGITQPQYDGELAQFRDIEKYFEASGWTWIKDPGYEYSRDSAGHLIFFNYAWGVLAVDAMPRNCFIKDNELLPFDVILYRPDAELEEFLKLYPG